MKAWLSTVLKRMNAGTVSQETPAHPVLRKLWVKKSTHVETVRKRRGKKEPPLRTVDEGLNWAVALGQNSRGRVSEETGMRGGERFYSQGRCPSQVFPYKEESAGYSGGWCPRAPCRYLLGPGLGVYPRKFSQPLELVCGIFPGHTSTCPNFQKLEDFLEPVWKQCDPEERDLSEKSCWVNFHQTVGQHVLYISFYYLPC